jgi:DNA-binding response OmpR family regulator
VLIADDDPMVTDMVEMLLGREGYTIVLAHDGQAALAAAYERKPDVVILDVNMPKLDGWTVLSRLREVSEVPVLMLTDMDAETNKVRGLREGADDYVTKPFGRAELMARVEALIRRSRKSAPAGPDVTSAGPLEVRHEEGVASVQGQELQLTPLEFRLLSTFARNPRQVLSGERIVELLWSDPYTESDQVKLLVGRLRRKLSGPLNGEVIETVRGFGYRFNPPG